MSKTTAATQGYVARTVAPLSASLADLDARLQAVEAKTAGLLLEDDVMGLVGAQTLTDLQTIMTNSRAILVQFDEIKTTVLAVVATLSNSNTEITQEVAADLEFLQQRVAALEATNSSIIDQMEQYSALLTSALRS